MPVNSSTTTAHAYGEPEYWDNRYTQDPGPFDWYQKYKTMAPLLDLYVKRNHRILLVGCGNSTLGEDMVKDGYLEVVNIDISSVVVEAMRLKYQDRPHMKFIKMDVRDMREFESCTYDTIIDKGTLDSLMCGHNALSNAKKMLEEVGRILKNKGVYILITYGDPTYRLQLLKEVQSWTVTMHVIDRMERSSREKGWDLTIPLPLDDDGSSIIKLLGSNPEVHYIYICTKEEIKNKQNFNVLSTWLALLVEGSNCKIEGHKFKP